MVRIDYQDTQRRKRISKFKGIHNRLANETNAFVCMDLFIHMELLHFQYDEPLIIFRFEFNADADLSNVVDVIEGTEREKAVCAFSI